MICACLAFGSVYMPWSMALSMLAVKEKCQTELENRQEKTRLVGPGIDAALN